MSYILSALRKAEKERKQKHGFHLNEITEQNSASQPLLDYPRRRVPIATGSAALVILVGLAWWVANLPLFDSVDPAVQIKIDAVDRSAPILTEQSQESSLVDAVSEGAETSAVRQLPESLVPEGILYLEGRPQSSRLYVDGVGYRVGDQWRPGITITAIDQSGFVLSNGVSQQRYSLP